MCLFAIKSYKQHFNQSKRGKLDELVSREREAVVKGKKLVMLLNTVYLVADHWMAGGGEDFLFLEVRIGDTGTISPIQLL